MRRVSRPIAPAASGRALLTAIVVFTSPALATERPADCSRLAHDQRVTGLEPGVWISNVTAIAGFVFFAVDVKPEGGPALLMANLAALGPFLSFATSGCIVRPSSELSGNPRALPEFKTREEARAYREGAISGDAFIMGLNTVASGLMLLFVHKPASRIALGISAGFPLAYSLVNLDKFSPARDIDDALPGGSTPKATVQVVPEIGWVAGESAVGLGFQGRF
jgi:hypothetical protein